MDQQPPYQPPIGNSYDFIMNPQQPPKPKKIGLGGNSHFGLTIAFILGGAVLFMVVLAVIINIFSGGTSNKTSLISLAQTQNELIRVAGQGTKSAVQQTTKNLSVTVQYSVSTQQKQTLAYLANHGTAVGSKDLTLKQNASTDQQFATAKVTSTFDSVFTQIMQDGLTSYAGNLKQLYNTTTNTTVKELTSTYYEQTQLLISQIPYTQQSIQNAGQ
jgi:hypothetical protein